MLEAYLGFVLDSALVPVPDPTPSFALASEAGFVFGSTLGFVV